MKSSNQINFLDEVIFILKKNSIGLIPCDTEEIGKLELYFNVRLPLAFVEYLQTMGKYSGKVNEGTDCFYDDLFQLKEWAFLLLKENKVGISLPNDAFVFSMHQGYQFYFFRLSEGEDPPVYSYDENQETFNEFTRDYESFSSYLKAVLNSFHLS